MSEPTVFKITWGDEEKIVDGRQEAIQFAKAKSNEVPMNVNVESVDDGKSSTVSMTYSGGSLEVFVAETRGPERRPRKRDRDEESPENMSDESEDDGDNSESEDSAE
jgi:hypothetical protein